MELHLDKDEGLWEHGGTYTHTHTHIYPYTGVSKGANAGA